MDEKKEILLPKITNITALENCGDYGLFVSTFVLTFDGSIEELNLQAANIAVEGNVTHPTDQRTNSGVVSVEKSGNILTLKVDPFLYDKGFRISIVLNGVIAYAFTAADVTKEITPVVDQFGAFVTENGMPYRLFDPNAGEKLPLVVWFHGGGERGTDNRKPLVCGRSAVSFAEPEHQAKHPCLVLVTQTNGVWSDEDLAETASVVRKLIAEGKADPSRIYPVGLAAMQATLRFAAIYRDLVAAAIPIIYWKAYDIDWTPLRDLPMWCCIAENDFTGGAPDMEAFYHQMKDELGNDQIRLTLYRKEEMDALGLYGGLSHWSWIPTTNDPAKIDWLFAQKKS